ncbi:nucleoside hydrolase [Alteromonadaceae bacterium BrNp21-10]|nr:nucleoside hydrolase [Alteromonadaceae bacterium BrNp21-10]
MIEKVIIDTDPGIDDAMALFFAFQSPEIEVLGLTTVFGNVDVQTSAKNALWLCELAKQQLPVTQGCARPWIGPMSSYAHFVHGDDGLGNTQNSPPNGQLDPRHSAQFIVDMVNAHPNEISLVAIGPLTNLALALQLDPMLASKVKQVILMGGAATCAGNITPAAEANIWNDAYAAQIVFAADWQVTMIGLDITDKLRFNQGFLDELKTANPLLGGYIDRAAQCYMDFYSQGQTQRECRFHDVTTLAYLVRPQWFQSQLGKLLVSTDSLTLGQTVFCPQGQGLSEPWTSGPYTNVALTVDDQALKQLYLEVYAL